MRNRITWTDNQRQRLKEAVYRYNNAISDMKMSGDYDLLPNKTSVEREMELIETRQELAQRISELDRLQDEPYPVVMETEIGDVIAPAYLPKEISRVARSINERRKELRSKLLSDLIIDSPVKSATAYSNKNLRELNETNYYNGDDLDDLWEEEYPHTFAYAENYKDTWMEYNGNRMVPDIIDWFARHEPDALVRIFESGDDEVDIHYIYPDSKSYDKTPMIIRHNRIIAYWNELYREYSGNYHGDYEDWTRDDE